MASIGVILSDLASSVRRAQSPREVRALVRDSELQYLTRGDHRGAKGGESAVLREITDMRHFAYRMHMQGSETVDFRKAMLERIGQAWESLKPMGAFVRRSEDAEIKRLIGSIRRPVSANEGVMDPFDRSAEYQRARC